MLKHLFCCAFAALAVAACAPSGGEEEDQPSNAPFVYEFAEADEAFGSQARYIWSA